MSPTPWREERRAITCCFKCKPPKRYPGCGDHCKEYQEEKVQHALEKQRQREYKEKNPVIKQSDFNKY